MPRTECRSNNGCWTCRARRKKCDENSPSCKKCSSLHLECHRYGLRPGWMDGGQKEKEKVFEFKAIVKRNATLKRRSRGMGQRKEVTGLQPSKDFVHPQLPWQYTTSTTSRDCLSLLLNPISSTAQWPQNLWCSQTPDNFGLEDNSSNEIDPGLFSDLPGLSPFNIVSWAPDINLRSIESLDCLITGSQIVDVALESVNNDCSSMGDYNETPLSDINQPKDSILRPKNALLAGELLQILTSDELIMIRYYTDTILPSQFPFLDSETVQQTGSQLSELAEKSKMCAPSILSQSIYSQHSQLFRIGLDSRSDFNDLAEYYEHISLQRLLKSLKDLDKVTKSSVGIADTVTLIESQVCAAQITLSKALRKDPAWPDILKVVASLQPFDFNKIQHTNLRTLRLFQDTLVCLDILSCASTRMNPSFALKFQEQLSKKDSPLQLHSVTGCHNSVLECIMDIAKLAHWKHNQISQRSMSLIDLAKRALLLEQKLEDLTQRNLERFSEKDRFSFPKDTTFITNVYARAASVYLHVTISGPHPTIPEIKKGVTDTVSAIKLLPSARLLKSLTWPLCIAASLADGEDRQIFEQLERGLGEEFGKSQNIVRALNIARECWNLRIFSPKSVGSSKGYDWIDAMESLGDLVLLLF